MDKVKYIGIYSWIYVYFYPGGAENGFKGGMRNGTSRFTLRERSVMTVVRIWWFAPGGSGSPIYSVERMSK